MKKKAYIGAWILIGVALLAAIAIIVLFFHKEPAQGQDELQMLTVLDSKGALLLQTTSMPEVYDEENWAYLELVVQEAMQIVAKTENCSMADAKERLFTGGYEIHTAFDGIAFTALKEAHTANSNCSFACAMTDLQGGLVAVLCKDARERQINYLLERRSPHASLEPLSVYAPAMEAGKINWSSLYQDSPYMQTKGEDGNLRDWPANATNTYSQENKTIYEALRTSLNTVAVKCLADVGVSESISFLQTNFDIPLKEEASALKEYGQDQVIGSIALGYLKSGVTPVEMAGYYQIFANGGQYLSPKTVNKITLAGKAVYTRQTKPKQVISPATADVMNKLLQSAVTKGATGAAANCNNVQVAGKTGTGDDYADNWFVGVSPGYSMAVWHGQESGNFAGEMFALVMQKLYQSLPGANTKFVTHKNLSQLVYCVHSGNGFSAHCDTIDTGYYTSEDVLQTCDTCGKN